MTIAVIQFGGSNCDRDTVKALEHLGFDAKRVWYTDGLSDAIDGVVLPGGFSYGDYLRAGVMAARTPIMDDIRDRIPAGLPVLGICNGAQIGCEAGFTPGVFTTNADARFHCEHVNVRVETTDSPWTSQYEVGEVLTLPIAHGEGRFVLESETLASLKRDDRILFRYCEPDGSITQHANPNGSIENIAGICGDRRSIAVLMPHPERVTLPDIGPTDGHGILNGFETVVN